MMHNGMATIRPPFNPNVPGIQNFAGPWQALKVEPYSDGDQKHWPGKPSYAPSDERGYRIKLGRTWAQNLGITDPGVNYYLEDLPDGYGLFEARQPNGQTFYKRMFGHPSGRYYDSIVRFETHFLWLMSGMEGDCECVLCGKPKAFVPRPRQQKEFVLAEPRRRRDLAIDDPGTESARSSSAGGLATGREKRARNMGQTYPVDEEGTRDVYKECIQSLFKNRESRKGIKDDIIEEDSFDRETEHEALTNYLTRIEQQHSFIPRLGELVLWCNYFLDDHYLLKDTETNQLKFYSFADKAFHGFPDWRAGVVTAVPDSAALDGRVDFQDVLDLPTKKTNTNSSGFRVETIPDPNSFDKSASKQYRYLPLRNIRPLAHWQYVLHGYPKKRTHPSIHHALTLMTSISLLNKFEFTGEWPNGSVHCKGVYIGSELITIGDVVRIFAPPEREDDLAQYVLIVSSIRMNLLGIRDSYPEAQSPLLSSQTNITLIGSAYTNSPTEDYGWPSGHGKIGRGLNESFDPVDLETAKHLFRPVGTNDYGPWYPMHSSRHRYEVSHDQVAGRLHEPCAVKMWMGHGKLKTEAGQGPEAPNFNFDVPGILAGRRYATQTDQRIADPPLGTTPDHIMWHLADYRAQGLAIATSNGLEVGPYDPVRTKKTLARWRNVLKVCRGDFTAAKELVISHQRGRPAGTRVVDGKLVELDEADAVVLDQDFGYAGKRRGRPPGTKIIDGKLVYPGGSQSQGMRSAAREETESEISATSGDEDLEMIEINDPTSNRFGGLDGNTSFTEHYSPQKFGDEQEYDTMDDGRLLAGFRRPSTKDNNSDHAETSSTNSGGSSNLDPPPRPASSKGQNRTNTTSTSRFPLTKEQIMRTTETGNFADDEEDDQSSDDEEWWKEPLPPARGGTEESEGGDYDPTKESQEERAIRKSKERKERKERKDQPKSKPKYVPPPGSGYRTWVTDW
jgi:hypothetical protein